MKQITLPELVAEKGQSAAAKALGVSPPAIAKALSTDRKIIVTLRKDGTYEAHELRPFPSQSKHKVA
jgi:hypothetical protein